ncbi:hypothetical protein Hanom_Chr11g00984951 [Helianthus anomalus]
MIVGLNRCRIAHALRENQMIDVDLIQAFWKTASINRKGANGAGTIEAKIHRKEISISEAIVREVLMFGTYPPLLKKMLPPYWRLLMHMFLLCFSENKGGSDQLNQIQASAFVALIEDWDSNYSSFLFIT